MGSPPGFEPGPHWWEASALTTVPPLTIIHSKKESFIVVPFVSLQLRQEKIQLEQTLEQEQEYQVNKLMRKIDKLESDVTSKQTTLEQVMNVLYLSAALITNLIYYCILLSLHAVSLPHCGRLSNHPDLVGILLILLENFKSGPVCNRIGKIRILTSVLIF